MHSLVLLLPLFLVAPPPGKPDVPALVRQLGADNYFERQAASAALARIGPPALEDLFAALRSPDLEVRLRARRLVTSISRRVYRLVRVFEGNSGSVNGVAFSPNGKCAVSGDSRAVRLWDLATGKMLGKTEEHGDRIVAVCFSPDGKHIASASEDRTARLWDARTLQEQRVYRGHGDYVRAVAFGRHGKRLFTASMDRSIREWEVDTGKPRRTIARCKTKHMALALCPDGTRVVTAGLNANSPVLWDLSKGKEVATLAGHTRQVLGVCVSSDGKLALTASHDRTVGVWDLPSRKLLYTFKEHAAEVCCVAISRDARKAISAGIDRSLWLWDPVTGIPILELKGHTGPVWCVAFSPDGTQALSGSSDGTIRLWSVGPRK